MGTIHIPDTHKVTLKIGPVDAAGQAAKLDGVPVWGSSDPTVATVEASTDGLSATVTSQAPGTATVTVSADADLGAGVVNLSDSIDVVVEAGQATALDLTAGTPEPK